MATYNFGSSGLFVNGVPMLGGGRFSSPWATHYFVDGDDGSDGNNGKSSNRAFKTIQKAITASTGGDVIYIRPKTWTLGTGFARYTEDLTVSLGGSGGSGATATNAGISIIGVTPQGFPNDHLGVRHKYSTTSGYNLVVDAPRLHVENIGFFAEDATYAIHLRCNGVTRTQEGTSGFSMYNCGVKGAYLYAEGGDGLQIVNTQFQAKHDGSVAAIQLVGSANQVKRALIQGCHFIGGNANNMSGPCIIGAAPWYDCCIRDCYFHADPDGSIYINIAGSSSTGTISNCHFSVADVSTGRIVEGGLICTGIYDGGGLATAT